MRIIFAGTPVTAVPSLERLASEHEVIAVLTRAPAPVGRKRVLTPSPVEQRARELGIDVLTPKSLRDEEIQESIKELAPDAVAVVAYGLLIPPALLDVPTHGWVNLHFSLLPQWRGAAPVQYAVAAGQSETGIATFQIEKGLDTGPVFDVEKVEIGHRETAGDLLERLSVQGADLLSRTMKSIEDGTANPVPQEGEPTHAPQLRAADGRLDLTRSARELDAQIRGFTPAPGCWTTWNGDRVKVGPAEPVDVDLSVGEILIGDDVLLGTGEGALRLEKIAPPGKPWMDAGDWGRGVRETVVWNS